MQRIDRHRSFSGWQERWQHASTTCNCEMTFSLYLPPQAEQGEVPLLIWLSGLTCTDENFVLKAGAQRYASEYGIAILCPDTSPRGEGVADVEAWDLGQGAGFYCDTTQAPWAAHYQMYSYVTRELPLLVGEHFPLAMDRCGMMGHSMGGHGALICYLRNPGQYQSVSVLAPISAPLQSSWGEQAMKQYLGDDPDAWRLYDASILMQQAKERLPLLVDQGADDEFLAQLMPERLKQACDAVGHPCELRIHEGYDHSYFFVASFIGEHIAHHAKTLLEA